MRCAACPEYQLSLPNNANGSKYSLKKFNPSAWGGSHQKFDFVVADLLDFDKVRCCAGELKLFRLSVRSCEVCSVQTGRHLVHFYPFMVPVLNLDKH